MDWQETLWLSMANAALVFTVTEMKISLPLRERLKVWNHWLGEMFSCGYCFGHWSALVLTSIYKVRLFHGWWPLDLVMAALVIAWLSAFQWILLCCLMKMAGK